MSSRGLILMSLAAFTVAGCAARLSEPAASASVTPDSYVGTKRWVSRSVDVCTGPPPPNEVTIFGASPCEAVKGGAFTIGSKTQSRIVAGYMVKFDNGRAGWISDSDIIVDTHGEDEHKRRLTAKAECDRRGGVRIGMTREQVYASCWGKPQHINKTVGTYGVHEQLVYGGSSYVYLENGIVRSIQTSER